MPRRRIIARITGLFALGLLTTVAVAWVFAFVDVQGPAYDAVRPAAPAIVGSSKDAATWPGTVYVVRYRHPGAAVFYSSATGPDYSQPLNPLPVDHTVSRADQLESLLPAWALDQVVPWLSSPSLWPQANSRETRSVEMTGWPLLCLFSLQVVHRDIIQSSYRQLDQGGIWLPQGRFHRRVGSTLTGWTRPVILPYRFHGPSLIANGVMYALVWSLLLFAPKSLRSHLRRRRNLCPRCAYSLLNLPPNSPCPECGHTRDVHSGPSVEAIAQEGQEGHPRG